MPDTAQCAKLILEWLLVFDAQGDKYHRSPDKMETLAEVYATQVMEQYGNRQDLMELIIAAFKQLLANGVKFPRCADLLDSLPKEKARDADVALVTNPRAVEHASLFNVCRYMRMPVQDYTVYNMYLRTLGIDVLKRLAAISFISSEGKELKPEIGEHIIAVCNARPALGGKILEDLSREFRDNPDSRLPFMDLSKYVESKLMEARELALKEKEISK